MAKKNLIIRVCVDMDEYSKVKREAYFKRMSMSGFVRARLFEDEE